MPFGTKLVELFHARDIPKFCFINKLKTDQVKLHHIVTCYGRESKEDFTLSWMRKKCHGLLRYMRNHYLYGNIPKKLVLFQSRNGFNLFLRWNKAVLFTAWTVSKFRGLYFPVFGLDTEIYSSTEYGNFSRSDFTTNLILFVHKQKCVTSTCIDQSCLKKYGALQFKWPS